MLVSKYTDHLPLYRQSEIYACDGLDLDRSTLSDWVGQAVWLMQPIVEGIGSHVFAAEKIHADDTPVPVLEPGLGRTRTGRLWVYVRDDRPFCGPAPPAVYFYSTDRGGEHPAPISRGRRLLRCHTARTSDEGRRSRGANLIELVLGGA